MSKNRELIKELVEASEYMMNVPGDHQHVSDLLQQAARTLVLVEDALRLLHAKREILAQCPRSTDTVPTIDAQQGYVNMLGMAIGAVRGALEE